MQLNVRGICCLRPGVPDVSENIEVVSIVDRYLEHARIFYFRNGGHEEFYMSSADWMVRNLDKRLEILFPVQQESLKKRLYECLGTYFADNVKARRLLADGQYEPVPRHGKACGAAAILSRRRGSGTDRSAGRGGVPPAGQSRGVKGKSAVGRGQSAVTTREETTNHTNDTNRF